MCISQLCFHAVLLKFEFGFLGLGGIFFLKGHLKNLLAEKGERFFSPTKWPNQPISHSQPSSGASPASRHLCLLLFGLELCIKSRDQQLTGPWFYVFIPCHLALVVQEINLRRRKEEIIISVLEVGNGVTEAVNFHKSEKRGWVPIFWCFNHIVMFFLCPLVTSGMMMISEDFHRSGHLWLPKDTFRGLIHKAMLSCTGLSGGLYPRSG